MAASAQTASDYAALVQKGTVQLQAGSADLALASGEAAIKISTDRWEGYALSGGALMNLKRFEDAADKLSSAIQRAPEAKQPALRDLRRQCLLAESGASPAAKAVTSPGTTQAEIVLWKSIENSTNTDEINAYLKRYPEGAFVPLAQQRLASLEAAAQERARLAAEMARQAPADTTGAATPQRGYWVDATSRLMWAGKDNGSDINQKNALEYCRNLRLAGFEDWRLPKIGELAGLDDRKNKSLVIKGIQLTGRYLISATSGNNSTNYQGFAFGDGYRGLVTIKGSGSGSPPVGARALCVRPTGE